MPHGRPSARAPWQVRLLFIGLPIDYLRRSHALLQAPRACTGITIDYLCSWRPRGNPCPTRGRHRAWSECRRESEEQARVGACSSGWGSGRDLGAGVHLGQVRLDVLAGREGGAALAAFEGLVQLRDDRLRLAMGLASFGLLLAAAPLRLRGLGRRLARARACRLAALDRPEGPAVAGAPLAHDCGPRC